MTLSCPVLFLGFPAFKQSDRFLPVVGRVVGETLVVLNGMHRLTACVALGRDRVRAYDLLV